MIFQPNWIFGILKNARLLGRYCPAEEGGLRRVPNGGPRGGRPPAPRCPCPPPVGAGDALVTFGSK